MSVSPSAVAAATPRTVFPTVFLTHGGGPSYFLDMPESHPFFPISKRSENAQWLRDFSKTYNLQGASAPKAIVVISAHFVTSGKTVHVTSRAQHKELNYDYGGFPRETYELQYAPAGNPALSQRIVDLLSAGGVRATLDTTWRFDHGVFIPLKMMWPEAEVPVVELSIDRSYDPAWHLQVGQALQQLKHEGVLIIGSGSSTHNFQADQAANRAFMKALGQAIETPTPRAGEDLTQARNRQAGLEWSQLAQARLAHPEEDHLVPLFAVLGAAGSEQTGRMVGKVNPQGKWCLASALFD